jgi:ABC-type transport system involved in multi-copper enzyme maturation permease subunit
MKTDLLSIETADLRSLENVTPAASELARRNPVSFVRQSGLIAAKEFGDRFRSGWVIACVMLWLGAIGLTSFLGLLQIGSLGIQGYERTVISLLNLVQYLVPLLGLLLGHDLIVSEKEDRTLRLLVAAGVSRARVLFGKFLGGCISLAVPLVLGFLLSGLLIGLAARDTGIGPFVKLALSGLGLGILFLGIGLMISTFSRTKVQALVSALLAWCLFIFVFDLVTLGLLVSSKAPAAAREIEQVCDATHVNAAADIHSSFDTTTPGENQQPAVATPTAPSIGWLAINPVDIFRTINLPSQFGISVSWLVIAGCLSGWLLSALGISLWKLRRMDL